MNHERIRRLAHEWYDPNGPMPSVDVAHEHFRKMARQQPTHATEYGEALLMFMRDRRRTNEKPSNYAPAASHANADEFRKRMREYAKKT